MGKYSFITRKEFRSLLYYQGATENIMLDSSEKSLERFYCISNAYEVINMLLFPGIENEKSRLQVEQRWIDDSILDNMDELLNVYSNLYSAMCKYTHFTASNKKFLTYRDDRKHTYQCMQDGINDSFLSTSITANRDPTVGGSCFQQKDGLVLLDVEALDSVEHIDMNDVLDDMSVYPDENEILYPPFLYLDTEEMKLTLEENQLEDFDGNAPYGKFHISLKGSTIVPKKLTEDEMDNLQMIRSSLITKNQIINIKFVWKMIQSGAETNYCKEINQYCQWKEKLRLYLQEVYTQIKFETTKMIGLL